MNLELKDEFKKGGFGKVTAGIGDKERMEVKGNYNKFDQKNQFSLIGLGNNTNQVGMGFDDFQDFRGSQWVFFAKVTIKKAPTFVDAWFMFEMKDYLTANFTVAEFPPSMIFTT